MKYNKKILIEPDPILRKKAKEVPPTDIQTPRIHGLIKKMAEVLLNAEHGVGLAAPQIGESLRIFVVLKKALDSRPMYGDIQADKDKPAKKKIVPLDEVDVYINPKIINQSRNKIVMDEGCLSVPYMYGKIKRAEKVTVRALNERGGVFQRGASGLLAEIIQHEIDHLNGILFIDSAKNVQKYQPQKNM